MRLVNSLLVVWLFSFSLASADQPINIPDPNLKAAIEAQLWVSDPTPADMLGLTRLCANNQGIGDLTGLQYATNLVELELTNNRIHSISVVSGLTHLRSLVLNNNYIRDVSVVSGLTNLEVLDVHNNELTDISAVSSLTRLHTLYFRINRISDIAPIRGLTNLETLELRDNQISDISALAGLTKLHSLWLGTNSISNISPLSGLTELRYLALTTNQISDISPLSGLKFLTFLTLSGNPLNADAYAIYLPLIKANNPSMHLSYDPPFMHRVTISSTVGGAVTNPGEGEFSVGHGVTLTLKASADPGFKFASWSGTYGAGDNPTSLVVNQDQRIQANFVSVLDTLFVDGNTPGDPQASGTAEHPFARIQEAVEVAHDGAVIVVRAGTYHESIDFLGKSLELRGEGRQDTDNMAWPVIEAAADSPAVTFSEGRDPNGLLLGFVFTGGKGRLAGGIRCARGHATIANCLIVGNRSTDAAGAAVYCTDSSVLLINCTIADNRAGSQGAGLYLRNSNIVVANSILWGNAPREIVSIGTGGVSASYSAIAGGWPGAGNLEVDPLFACRGYWASGTNPSVVAGANDPAAVWVAGDYHLQSQTGRWDTKTGGWVNDEATSPCIDTGDPASAVGAEPAPNDGLINMGAYGATSQASKSAPRTTSP